MSAYEELVRRYQELAFRVAYVVTRDPETARDAAQSGFIKAYYAMHRFRTGAPFRPWLLRIITNEAHNQMRAQGRRRSHELHLAAGRSSHDAAPSSEELALESLSSDGLLNAVNMLAATDREVIAYRFFLGLSEAEMAAAMNRRKGTVKSRLARALGRLRSDLGSSNSGEEL